MASCSDQAKVPTLQTYCLHTLAQHINLVSSLEGVPEELVISLFEEVIKRGKLTPGVLKLFRETQHELMLLRIKQLGISDWLPPLVPTRSSGWLGDKPRYF